MNKNIRVETYKTYWLSNKTKLTIKDDGNTYTISKPINPIQNIVIKLTADEVQNLIHVFSHKSIIDSVGFSDKPATPKQTIDNDSAGEGDAV